MHINNLYTNKHNKAIYALADTLMGHPATQCFTIINTWNCKERTPNNTIP